MKTKNNILNGEGSNNLKRQIEGDAMNPATPKIELQPLTPLQKAVARGSLMTTKFNDFGSPFKGAGGRGFPRATTAALIVLLSCAVPLALPAAVNNYTPAGDGAWDAAGNWSTGLTPASTDSIFITNGAYTVVLTNTTAATWMTVSNLTVSSSGAGPNLLVNFTDQSKTLTVGSSTTYGDATFGNSNGQSGTLTVSNGNFSTKTMTLGNLPGSTGIWNIVGGTNTIRSDSGWGYVLGAQGYGSMLLNGGVFKFVTGSLSVGNSPGSLGVVTVSNGSYNSYLTVLGLYGTGNYNISGGTNTMFALRLGQNAGSKGTVNMTGGELTVTRPGNAGTLEVGFSGGGQGTFNLSGGTVTADNFLMANGAQSAFNFSGGTLNTTVSALIGAGSLFTITNHGNAQISGVFTNSGTVRVVNSTVTWQSNLVVSGSYISDPSTNIFASTLTVTPSGSLSGSNGDLFVFYQDLANQSTNRSQFNLAYASVLFTNGNGGAATNHTLNLAGSGAVDMGSNFINHTQLATNFSIGTLSIATGNRLTLTGDKASQTNALYAGVLDLSAWATDAASLTNTLQAALSLPNINLYYDKYAPNNAYLQGVEFGLWVGGGSLIPIPEPSALLLIGASALLLGVIQRRKKE